MTLPRFRLRTFLVAVGLVGTALGLVLSDRETWRSRYQGAAEANAEAEAECLREIDEIATRGGDREILTDEGPVVISCAERVAVLRDQAAWHEQMKRKYAHAAHYPWSSLPLDPPRPTGRVIKTRMHPSHPALKEYERLYSRSCIRYY